MTAPNNQPLSKENLDKFKVYVRSNGGAGVFSIVLEDKNVQDKHVQFCKELAEKSKNAEAVELADIMLGLSKSQRIKLANTLKL